MTTLVMSRPTQNTELQCPLAAIWQANNYNNSHLWFFSNIRTRDTGK